MHLLLTFLASSPLILILSCSLISVIRMPSGNSKKRKAQRKIGAKSNNQAKPQNSKAKEDSSTNQIADQDDLAPTNQLFPYLEAANNLEITETGTGTIEEINGTETMLEKLEIIDIEEGVDGNITGKQQQQQRFTCMARYCR